MIAMCSSVLSASVRKACATRARRASVASSSSGGRFHQPVIGKVRRDNVAGKLLFHLCAGEPRMSARATPVAFVISYAAQFVQVQPNLRVETESGCHRLRRLQRPPHGATKEARDCITRTFAVQRLLARCQPFLQVLTKQRGLFAACFRERRVRQVSSVLPAAHWLVDHHDGTPPGRDE